MPNPESSNVSPLAAIRDKERALSQEIRVAQERANAKVTEAHARAEAIKQQAERDGMSEADKLYQNGLAVARTESVAISKAGETQAAQQHQSGMRRIAEAMNYIVSYVLPHES
jgi:vacuolar-type H+-ATPase subunit H